MHHYFDMIIALTFNIAINYPSVSVFLSIFTKIRNFYLVIKFSDNDFRFGIEISQNFVIFLWWENYWIKKQKKTTTMESKIIKAFEEKGAMRPGDIATATGIAKEDVSKVIKKMVADGTVYSPKRCFYDLKK